MQKLTLGQRVKQFLFGATPSPFSALCNVGDPLWKTTDYITASREAYMANWVVLSCIQKKAAPVAAVPWYCYTPEQGDNGKWLEKRVSVPEIEDMFLFVNDNDSWLQFITATIASLDLGGKAYWRSIEPKQELECLYVHETTPRFDDGQRAIIGYEHTSSYGGVPTFLSAEEVRYIRNWHPLDKWGGLAAIQAAAKHVDIANAGAGWNLALLQNSARPGGILSTDATPTPEQREDVLKAVEARSGAANQGKSLFVWGGIKYDRDTMTPTDMAWGELDVRAALAICNVLGVPAQKLNIPGSEQYANKEQSEESFVTDSILPVLTRVQRHLQHWQIPKMLAKPMMSHYPPNLRIAFDTEAISALQEDRDALYARTIEAVDKGIITLQQACDTLGYDWDEIGTRLVDGDRQTLETVLNEVSQPDKTGASRVVVAPGSVPDNNKPAVAEEATNATANNTQK